MVTASSDNHAYTIPKADSYQSQHGEDKWLDKHFHQKRQGFFVEVGAYDGIVLSNTYHFEKERAWSGILVEPDARKADLCRKNRANSHIYECAAIGSGNVQEISFFQVDGGEVYSTINLVDSHRQRLEEYGLTHREVRVRAMTLDQILTECQPPRIDFLSIDVEEAELEVLKGFNIRRWKPRIVIVESNSSERKPEIRDYFVRNGYAYLHSVEVNDFYRPVLGGAVAAKVLDHFRYKHARKPKVERSYLRQLRRFLDRHLLWRFKSH